jgi:hypothetical protein
MITIKLCCINLSTTVVLQLNKGPTATIAVAVEED